MNKLILTLIGICLSIFSLGQTTENNKLIELGKAYKNFMFSNEPPMGFVNMLQLNMPEDLNVTASFIVQTITTGNDLLKPRFLALPDSQALKFIYIIRAIDLNIRKEDQVDNTKLIDSLKNKNISKNEVVDNYYDMLFTSIGNKNKPFDLSKFDFKLNDYNLSNDTEKGIFFLQCMDYCESEIWGYMNIVKPPNTKKAFNSIRKYPKFNGLKYFQFTDLNFPDFEIIIEEGKGMQSYKKHYINRYYDLLLSHLICLNKEGAKEKDINDLLLGSILKDSHLYKYSKNKEVLEGIFIEQKR